MSLIRLSSIRTERSISTESSIRAELIRTEPIQSSSVTVSTDGVQIIG